jgi:hypothetical protein
MQGTLSVLPDVSGKCKLSVIIIPLQFKMFMSKFVQDTFIKSITGMVIVKMCLRVKHLGICACEITSRITHIVEVC